MRGRLSHQLVAFLLRLIYYEASSSNSSSSITRTFSNRELSCERGGEPPEAVPLRLSDRRRLDPGRRRVAAGLGHRVRRDLFFKDVLDRGVLRHGSGVQ